MSRRLLTPLILALFLLYGASAPACPTCALPASSAPVLDPAPEAVFEADAPGALLPEERDWILGLEGGRYATVNGRLADRQTASPGTHLLANSAAWKLLGRRASERVAVLRPLLKNGKLPQQAHAEAVALFWLRGTLVSPADQAFLQEAAGPKSGPKRAAGGLKEAAGSQAPPPGATAGPETPSSARTAALLGSLRATLDVASGSDPAGIAAMDEALKTLVETPTGRALALEFVASGAKAKIEYGAVDNSATRLLNGRRVLMASGGHTDFSFQPPVVRVNRDYLVTDPDYRRTEMVTTIGHELLGHVLEQRRSAAAGVPSEAFDYYRGDEAGAGLIGWLLQTELGARLDDGNMWNYVDDPEKYHAALATNLPYYSTTFSAKEMRAPMATLESRLASIAAARRESVESAAGMEAWRPQIAHFVEVHSMDLGKFSSLIEDIDSFTGWNDGRQKDLNAVQKHLENTIAWLKTPEAAATLAALTKTADSPYLRRTEERLAAHAGRLRGLVAGRKQEPTIPPVPGKLSWDDLTQMVERDRKDHPKHWEGGK